jgi:L-threonine kinase
MQVQSLSREQIKDLDQVTVRVPGSCGELIQGELAGQNFLLSCPINLYSKVKVNKTFDSAELSLSKKSLAEGNKASALELSKQAAQLLLAEFGLSEQGYQITINSELLVGEGMASSTSDITAVLAALSIFLTGEISFDLLAKIAVKLEPTDSVFLSKLTLFNHLTGQRRLKLGTAPSADLLIFRELGQINSRTFNQAKNLVQLRAAKKKQVKRALTLIKQGIEQQNLNLIGQGSTLSSQAHQMILPKRSFQFFQRRAAAETEIYGVVTAHSGTLIALLVREDYPETKLAKLIKDLKQQQLGVQFWRRTKFISGGIERKRYNADSTWWQYTSDS